MNGGDFKSQKELNYMEDVYNHEKLVIDVLKRDRDMIDDDNYIELFNNQIDKHTDLVANIEKYLGDACE